MKVLTPAIALAFSLLAAPSIAQTFSSGSTGADGALDLATMNCATGPNAPPYMQTGCWIQLPESGVLNYTTINVPSGKELYFKRNRGNTPVVLLAQGDVSIDGHVGVDANLYEYGPSMQRDSQNQPGPGGFPGAAAKYGLPGLGPGGGTTESPNGRWVGPLSLVPIVGGSGGAAGLYYSSSSIMGGGGAGAIVIASGGSISMTGNITAQGNAVYLYMSGSGPCGSGGAVRLVANRLVLGGSITATSCGMDGAVRLEAPTGAITYTGYSSPAALITTINPAIVAAASPELRIVSVGGFSVPDSAGNRKDAADMVLPKQLPDPIDVVVSASNIPLGSPVTVTFGTSNTGTAPSVPLTGILASSTATIGVSGLNRNALAYLYVQVLFTPPGGGSNAPEADRVAQVRMTNSPGAKPQFAFLRKNGTEVPVDRLPADLKKWVSDQSVR